MSKSYYLPSDDAGRLGWISFLIGVLQRCCIYGAAITSLVNGAML